jgi:hypothetical protein
MPPSLIDKLASPAPGPAVMMSDPAPDPSPSDPDTPALASLPGYKTRPAPLPGRGNPDPLPPDAVTGAASSSSEQKASIRAFSRERAKSYAKIAGTLMRALGGYLNTMSGEPESDAFIPDEDDDETIPPPLGRLAARRVKLGADPEQLSDVEDIAQAAIGTLVWLAKGATALFEARRARRRAEQDKALHSDRGDGL